MKPEPDDKLQSAYSPKARMMKMGDRTMPTMKPPPKTSGNVFKPRESPAKITPVQRSEKRIIAIPTETQTVEPKRIYKRVSTKGR